MKELIERYDNYKAKHPRSKVGVYAKKYPQKKKQAYVQLIACLKALGPIQTGIWTV
jgi:hypothetical protein